MPARTDQHGSARPATGETRTDSTATPPRPTEVLLARAAAARRLRRAQRRAA
ncbi:MAG: hypothetical protein AAGC46_02050 [Solirubrobacteraceae bacterium]|nr:hypothetical protein [Patulibacter sp.]